MSDDVQKPKLYRINLPDDIQAPKLLALSERDRVVWNEAIEEAAKMSKRIAASIVGDEILKLKK